MTSVESGFEARIASLDESLLDGVSSQSSSGDRRAWLAVQRSVRSPSGYHYLEIGSHLGGSIQQHLVDPSCKSIISLDKRPPSQPDDRGQVYHYEGNSTARMLDNLRPLSPTRMDRIVCFDSDAKDLDPAQLTAAPDFCFIDGEHTQSAVLSDFAFCLRVCAPEAAICFHDDYVLRPALEKIVADLRKQGIRFKARKMTGVTFGIFLRDCPAARDPDVLGNSMDAALWFRLDRLRRIIPARFHPAARRMKKWVEARLRRSR